MREPWTRLWHHSFLKTLPSVLLCVTQSTHGSQAVRGCYLKWAGWFVDHTRHFSGLLGFTEAILVGSVLSPVSWLSFFLYLAMCGYQMLLLWAGESTRWNSTVSHSVSYSPIFSLASDLPYLCYGFRSHITLVEPMHVPPGNVREFLFHSTNLWPIRDGARELTPFSFILLGSPKNLLFIWTLRRLCTLALGTRVLQSHEHLYSGFHLCCPLHPGFLAFL